MGEVFKYGLDDPVWDHVLRQRLEPYIPYARRWWQEIDELAPYDTGVYQIDYDIEEQPPGLFFRFTRTPIRSPIKGIQAFPFVVAAYLQITGVPGGSTKLIQRKLMSREYKIDEFTCIDVHNLPSTFNQGQLVAFVPTDVYIDTQTIGKWIYLTDVEISGLIQGRVLNSVQVKAIKKG
jgi:hypothetical protein